MILVNIFVFYFYIKLSNAIVYDYYTASMATEEQLLKYGERGNLDVCTVDIEPCCKTDRKRVDASCNSLDYPARGTFFVPPVRVLPALYFNGSYPRKAKSGKDLELPRVIRTVLLSEGKNSDSDFTQLMTSFAIFMFGDVGSTHDILFFLQNKTDCCAEGRNDYMCTPNIVPSDDPIHRMTGIDCLNLTRPLTYQFFGCTDDPIPAPIVRSTSAFDLSLVYNAVNGGEKAVRSYVGGELTTEVENDKIWPPSGGDFCPLNEARFGETRCFKNHPKMLITVVLFAVWFVRLHNYYASQLRIVNPCWDDETLFQVARDLNIASAMEIFLHEWLAQLEGYENLVDAGVISEYPGHRDLYDDTKFTYVTLEYTFILRWFHIVQESTAKLYDTDGSYLRDFPMFNLTFRPAYLTKDKNMEYLTQGHFRQPCGRFDDSVDLEVANNGIPGMQLSVDVPTSDLHKGRLLGLRPYVDYIYYCTGDKVTSFKDLARHVSKDKIYELRKVYDHVRDIDLMAGLWVEKFLVGGKLPRTLACLMNDNILDSIQGDRHWYESSTRPHAFTERQLKEIRKASLAYILCTVGDGVTEIQREAFRTISRHNPLWKCEDIPQIDVTAWADPECCPQHGPYY